MEGPYAEGGHALFFLGQGADSPRSLIRNGDLDPGAEVLLYMSTFPNSGDDSSGNGGV